MTCDNENCIACALRMSIVCAMEFERQVAQRAFVISEARLKKEGVQAINPVTGEPSLVNVCAWHAFGPVDKVRHAMSVALELVERN